MSRRDQDIRGRRVLNGSRSLAVGVFALLLLSARNPAQSASEKESAAPGSIRRFHVHFADEALADLRRRVAATRWPDKETVADDSQGVQLATMQALAHYWATTTTGARSRRS